MREGADTTGALAKTFGVYLDDAGLALRGTFLINPEGTLMNAEVNFLNMGRNIDELMRKFKANLYLAKKTDEGIEVRTSSYRLLLERAGGCGSSISDQFRHLPWRNLRFRASTQTRSPSSRGGSPSRARWLAVGIVFSAVVASWRANSEVVALGGLHPGAD